MSIQDESVSRVEMVDVVANAFRVASPTRQEILSAAIEHRARPAVIQHLERLPERRYTDVRDIWTELPDVPVGM